ncbi:MAG: bifunctional phosphopantothenoylcysteine decarboxylase/phosphopantothenate--cysteine ligase CoaBC [Alphaproteobacteria bacterium]|jgi:phosphopantothenoylcysteine decarboxylase/phosphopantothenate--cysteine ligase|nr:bifunctional phosphopantothenoylcysteine decarboxylase/phosphopantothenate--cysteine ligase CoaBC [Alphaproteobacteria bacterium]
MKKNILVCVSGGIAAYKAPNVVSSLLKKGYDVDVAMTKNATQFISPQVFEALTGKATHVDLFNNPLSHINLGKKADVILVVPATFNLVGKVANGIADDLVSSIISAYHSDIFFALAMNDNMYTNPILQKNIVYLKSLKKYHFIEADEGHLACNTNGVGRLKPEEEIVQIIEDYLYSKSYPQILQGKKVVITAGKTKEYLDPVRYISNDSTGKMGYSLARTAKNLGADVSLIIGENNLPQISGVNTVNIINAQQMFVETLRESQNADIVIFSAAVSDYRFMETYDKKLKKNPNQNEVFFKMIENVDIAREIGNNKQNKILVGFALESENLRDNALKKITSKNLDFIVANSPQNLGSDNGAFYLINKKGESINLVGSKKQVALEILQNIIK